MNFSQESDAKLVLENFDDYAKKVSDAYMARPKLESDHAKSWHVLMQNLKTQYKRLQSKFDVRFVKEDPYKSFEDMRDEVLHKGVLRIYEGDSDHPIWTPEENIIFRTVHDALGHLAGYQKGKGHRFTLRGELGVYNRQIKLVSPEARIALFTEIVGQVCTGIVKGGFQVQKVCKLWGFDYVQVGEIDDAEYEKNFEEDKSFRKDLAAKYLTWEVHDDKLVRPT